ncbi:hypothetical protein AAMO2058_000153900, partial [Amorphochlora amoebiformis]
MGANIPSREVGGEAVHAAQQDLLDDAEVLDETGEVGKLDSTYKKLLTYGLLSRPDGLLKKKKEKQKRKLEDSEIVLQTSLSTTQSDSQFRRKQLKCLQRNMSFLSRSAEPFADLMASRAQYMHRIATAFQRTIAHEKKKGKWYQASTEDKAKYIQHVLKGFSISHFDLDAKESTDFSGGFGMDEEFIKKAMELAATLPEIYGSTGTGPR